MGPSLHPASLAGCSQGIEIVAADADRGLMQTEIERDMKLMGCTAFSELSRDNLRFR